MYNKKLRVMKNVNLDIEVKGDVYEEELKVKEQVLIENLSPNQRNKYVREKLMTPNIIFTYPITWGEIKKFKTHTYNIDTNPITSGIGEDQIFGKTMNVEEFGPTCAWLYTYDMFNNQIFGKIQYSKVNFI
jgi:hypothetical protein